MAPRPGENEKGEFFSYVGDVPCYSCNLRGNGLSDLSSNWRPWNADKEMYREATTREEDEVFAEEEEVGTDRRRKAILWFTVGENLRQEHLVDMGGRDKSSDGVFRRLYERVAPPGTSLRAVTAAFEEARCGREGGIVEGRKGIYVEAVDTSRHTKPRASG
ncbi:hypothetical protein DL771_007884 [Monosporascus sp. 5C6A]|nr:hypothetical protein DL771_007884 [Monosporascus sp. 5C6A]